MITHAMEYGHIYLCKILQGIRQFVILFIPESVPSQIAKGYTIDFLAGCFVFSNGAVDIGHELIAELVHVIVAAAAAVGQMRISHQNDHVVIVRFFLHNKVTLLNFRSRIRQTLEKFGHAILSVGEIA